MPKLICRFCGNEVRLQGIAGICPHCGQLITADDSVDFDLAHPAPTAPDIVENPIPAEPVESEPVEFTPQPSRTLLYSIIGALAAILVLLLGIVIILATSRSTPAPVVVTPVYVPPPKRIEPPVEKPIPVAPKPAATLPVSRPAPPPPPPLPHAALGRLRPRAPQVTKTISDEQIGQAITRGDAFLQSQFSRTRLKGADSVDAETFAGLNALAIYALLHAGQALPEPKLGIQSEVMQDLLNNLKVFPMEGNRATYSRSLRISAFMVYNRLQDRSIIEADLQWLLKAAVSGSFSYKLPSPGQTHETYNWDNSNSQYGALGIWAAGEAGLRVPGAFWNDMERHWLDTQTPSGGWGYRASNSAPTLSMTAAGINMLFVARDRTTAASLQPSSYLPLSKAMQRSLDWLDRGDNAINVNNGHRGYTLYGLERAGLATGYKYFGTHDWYRELATSLISDQKPDGSWAGGDGVIAETSFGLLFLSRGRHPIFMAKLKFDGLWNNRPRDVSSLSRFAARELERPLNWQVADIARNWWEYSDAPALLITSNAKVSLSDAEIDKLRAYAQAGGLIFLNTENESEEFNQFARELSAKLFPDYPLSALPENHPIYSTMYPLQTKPPLSAVSNGSRLLLVHSPTDLSASWQPRPTVNQRLGSQMAMNIVIYASGRQDFRNRMSSLFVPSSTDQPLGVLPVARLKYEGNWDPEPMAWGRASRVLQNETGVALQPFPSSISSLKYESSPIAHLTGTGEITINDGEIEAIRAFVTAGGFLLIDACGGSQAFADSIEKSLLSKLSPTATVGVLSMDDPLLAGGRVGMSDIRSAPLRVGTPQGAAGLRSLRIGGGRVVFSRIDLSSGLAGARGVGIRGYQPAWCQELVRNITFATIARINELVSPATRQSQ